MRAIPHGVQGVPSGKQLTKIAEDSEPKAEKLGSSESKRRAYPQLSIVAFKQDAGFSLLPKQ